jgi:RND family efflux transporter MFP subunit
LTALISARILRVFLFAMSHLPFVRRAIPFLIALTAVGCDRTGKGQPRGQRDAAVQVTVAEAKMVPWERKLSIVGELFPNQEARIAAEVEGRVETTLVEVGDVVTKGAELAQIDTASYQGMVNLATANVAKAEAAAENQKENIERLNQLRKTGSVSPTDYDQAVAAMKSAIAEVSAAKATLGAANTSLRRSLVRAPFDGAVTERRVTTGDFVRISTVMFQVLDDSVLKFRGEVPEREAAHVKVGQAVRVQVAAFPGRPFPGSVTWINPGVNTATRGVGIEARMENIEHALKAHFFARAEIVTDPAAPTLVVPVDAVVTFAGVNKVYAVENEVAQAREVTLGGTRDDLQEIIGGLQPGERVVVTGRTKVQPGSRVVIAAP